MKRFQFPLERLRQWRVRQFEIEEGKLNSLQAELAGLVSAEQRVRDEERDATAAVLNQRELSAEQVRMMEQWRGYALREIRRIHARIAEVGHLIEDQRLVLLEARRRLESLDQLRADRLEEWKAEASREEEAAVGELVISRWGRE